MTFRWVLLASLALVASSSQAITRREGMTDMQARSLGNPAIVRINLRDNVSGANDYRSGTLVGDKFVLTAAHNTPGAGKTPIVTINGVDYNVTIWSSHPSFAFNNILNGFDVAIARLGSRVLNVAPVGVLQSPVTQNQLGEIHGYGGFGLGVITNYDWNLRGGTNAVDLDPQFPNIFLTDFDNPSNPNAGNSLSFLGSSSVATTSESCIAFGDSGGPFLVQDDGRLKVAGIASALSNFDGATDASYSDIGIYTKVQPVYAWIVDRLWENGRIAGTFTVPGYSGALTNLAVRVEIRNNTTLQVVQQLIVPIAIDGGFSMTTNLRGTYNLSFVVPGGLRISRPNVTITNNDPTPYAFTLRLGDINEDNEVGAADFSILAAAYDAVPGDPAWRPLADIDGNAEVGASDFSILAAHYELTGDE